MYNRRDNQRTLSLIRLTTWTNPWVVCLVLLMSAGCSKGSVEDPSDADELEEDAPPEIDIHFEGHFRHEAAIDATTTVVTELELREEGLQQRRNGFVVYDAPCTRTQIARRQMDFSCTLDEGMTTLWPLAFNKKGELYHLAMPEMRYTREHDADTPPSEMDHEEP